MLPTRPSWKVPLMIPSNGSMPLKKVQKRDTKRSKRSLWLTLFFFYYECQIKGKERMLPDVGNILLVDGTSSQPIVVKSFDENDSIETIRKKSSMAMTKKETMHI
jgi:hypothetical protein